MRSHLSAFGRSAKAAARACAAGGALADPILRADIARSTSTTPPSNGDAARYLGDIAGRASPPGDVFHAQILRRRTQQAPARTDDVAGGRRRAGMGGERSHGGEAARTWLRTKANSIEGGTSEIQLGIIAKHILELPGA